MNLYEQTKALWDEKAAARADQLAHAIRAAEPEVRKAACQFHEWKPLRFYLSVSEASGSGTRRSPTPIFSVRFSGQNVAKLTVAPTPMLRVGPKHESRTRRDFGLSTPAWKGGRDWKSPEAREFRAKFKRLAETGHVVGHSEEHAVESRIIEEMEDGERKTKFSGTFANVRPVSLAGFPFQCVLPISACKGVPKVTDGHIDILTRRGHGKGVRLGVWELKRPGKVDVDCALKQAYIYAVTLALMLRDKNGPDWYRIFGFKGPLPRRLELESVVAVSRDVRPKVERAAQKFLEANSFDLDDNVHIKPFAAYYDPETLEIDFKPLAGT